MPDGALTLSGLQTVLARRPDKTLCVSPSGSHKTVPGRKPDKARRHPAVTKQYLSVGRIRRFTSAIRQSQNSTRL